MKEKGYRVDPRNKDLSGVRFSRWTVIDRAPQRGYRTYWNCVCECGTNKQIRQSDLVTGHSKSCGCLNDEVRLETKTTHGMCRTSTYNTWMNMIGRCENKNRPDYLNYGARGISVCPRWRDSFEAFLSDMGEKPEGLSIERIDNSKGYYPENCKWATASEQRRNQRTKEQIEKDRAAAEIGRDNQ